MISNVISQKRLLSDFRAMGIVEGDHLGIAVSFKAIGRLDGGPDMFLDALTQVLGPSGTIMVNSFTEVTGLSKLMTGEQTEIFHHSSTPTITGVVAEALRQREDAVRSKHPVTSVAAIGRLANYLTRGHDHNASAFSPYSRLAEANGKILSVGLGDKLAGFRHEAQYLAGLLAIVPKKNGARYVDEDGISRIFVQKNPAGCVKRLHDLVLLLRSVGIVKDGYIGMASAISVPARESLRLMTEMLKKNPTLNLCDDFTCLWCRELERRMNLYGSIENRRWFQTNPLAIALIASANWFRLGGNPAAIWLRKLANALGVKLSDLQRIKNKYKNFQIL